ncbi:Uncharacterised protein [uncultured archaeon]|nr:Uncharacterised protein [uncultured archaeon]
MAEKFKTMPEEFVAAEKKRIAEVYRKAPVEKAPVEISTNTKGAISTIAQLTVHGNSEGFAKSILGSGQKMDTLRNAGDPREMSVQLLYAALDAVDKLTPSSKIGMVPKRTQA